MRDIDFDRLVSAVAKRLAELTDVATDIPPSPRVHENVIHTTTSRDIEPDIVQQNKANTSLDDPNDEEVNALALKFMSRSSPIRREDFPIEEIEL